MFFEVCKFCEKTLKRKEMKSHEIIQCLQEKIIRNEIFFKEQIFVRDSTIIKIQEDLQKEIALREKHEEMLRLLNEKLEKIMLRINENEEILEIQQKNKENNENFQSYMIEKEKFSKEKINRNEEVKYEYSPKILNKSKENKKPESLQNIKENMHDFMKLDSDDQKEILANFLFPKIKFYAEDDVLSTKVLEMLTDLTVFEVQDIIEFLENEEILKAKINEVKQELKLSCSKWETQEIYKEKTMNIEKNANFDISKEKSMKEKMLLEKIGKIVDDYELAYKILDILINNNEITEREIDELIQNEEILAQKIRETHDFILNSKSHYKNKIKGKDFKEFKGYHEKFDREGPSKKKYEREERGKRGGRRGHGRGGWRGYD